MNDVKALAACICVAALALPGAGLAKAPTKHPKKKPASACKHTPRVGFEVNGVVDEDGFDVDGNSFTIKVDSVSRNAKLYLDDPTLTLTDVAIDGPQPKAGDTVSVEGKIDKPKAGCRESASKIEDSITFTKAVVEDDNPGDDDAQ